MTTFQIVEAKPFHCGQMARLLRHEHQKAIAPTGTDTHRELRAMFDTSSYCRSWLIDGRLAALGGVAGTLLSATGFVWLALSEKARQYPLAIVRETRNQLRQIMGVKRELATTIINGDDAARRLAIFLGFHLADSGPGAPAMSRDGRRELTRYIEQTPDHRIPIGSSFVIAMGYHNKDAD